MTTATLSGFPLLGSSSVRWGPSSGVKPRVEEFDMVPAHADEVFKLSWAARKPQTLLIDKDGTNKAEFKNLWVLNVSPGDNPNIKRVVIADRRWFWSYGHTLRRYNIRRHTGTKRVVATNQLAIDPVIEKWQYAAYSLPIDGGDKVTKWIPKDVLGDVLHDASKIEQAFTGSSYGVSFMDDISNDVPIEGLTVDDPSDSAVMRVLSYLPEANLYINNDGDVVVYSKASGLDSSVVEALNPEIIGRGHAELVDNRFLRPKEIHVLFSYEVELRFDYFESSITGTQTALLDERVVENVLPIPDFTLPLPPASAKKCQGEYITVDQAFGLWGNLPNPFGGATQPLTHDLVQKAFMPFQDLWAAIGICGKFDPDRDWIPRVAALQQHYRQTFRINSRWVDRVLSIKPYRVATVDQASGQRAPAMAYSDYSLLNTRRSLYKDQSIGDHRLNYAQSLSGYPTTPPFHIDLQTKPTPAHVTIPDSDQGIVHLEFALDPVRLYEIVLPSKIEDFSDGKPSVHGNLTDRDHGSVAFDAVTDYTKPLPKLSANYKCAFIVTAIPASPNDNRQLFRVVVKPEDVKGLVPPGLSHGLESAAGPIMEIRVGAGTETARVQWLDSRQDDIDSLFGVGTHPPNMDGLVLNDDKKFNVRAGAASLQNIAAAAAARLYASLSDRMQGSITGDLNKSAVPQGWISEITHEVTTKGETTTHAALPPKVEEFNIMSFLDSSTRTTLLRLVQK